MKVEQGQYVMQKKQEEENNKKKVLIVTNHSYMLWQFRKELIFALSQKYEVVLCMPFVGREEDFKRKGFRCIETKINRRGINPITDIKLVYTYKCILKSEKPDMVITYSIKPNIYVGWLCGKMGIPFCANVQGLGTAFQKAGLAQFVTVLYKLAFRKVQTVFFENEFNAEEFQKRHIISIEKQTVLRGAGVNLEHYTYQPYPQNEKIHFLYLGRIMKEKGMDELFLAVRNLYQETKNFVLDLVGFFEDEYKEQVEQLEKEGIAVFHGFQKDPRPYYMEADCIVLPSYHEGMSNVLLEAAAVGRPLITNDIPGCREAVDDGVNGFLVKVKDAQDLFQKMKQFLDLDEKTREEMGIAGYEKMKKEFRKEVVVDKTIKALELDQLFVE